MASADRDLLFGLLALQNGLIDQSQLVAAFQAWTRDRPRPLAEHLTGRGDLDVDDRAAVEALVERHLRRHGGDAERSLASIPVGPSTRESLARIGDADVEANLAHLSRDSTPAGDVGDRTASYAVGSATSDGQRFRVLRPHAQGGLGAVFVALDAELHREVALKQILDHHADDPVSRQRFLLEAEVTGGLEHPGIVPVYGLGTYGCGRPYYAMRFIRGDSLKEAAGRFHAGGSPKADSGRRSLEQRKLLRRFQDVCNAIDYAHSRGVLHRDLKPGNIIVGKHGETLVVDWGLAKATGRGEPCAEERTLVPSSASGSAETLPGSALGTPAFMSPEQARGDLEHLGPQSDVYSLGATLYYVLTGKPPFEGEVGDVLRAVQRGDFAPPRRADPTVDRALEAVCLKAMATGLEGRYASPKALAEDVERWMADEPVTAWREPPLRQARRWAKRHQTAVTAAAAALVAGVVGLSAVLGVQTRAKAEIARALGRETRANVALAAANEELSRSKAAVQARYDLAVEAVRTFHTGVSEDFLLKQDQFRGLRDRLLTSAAEFHGRLAGLLGRETDAASRRALAGSEFEVAELTGKVGRQEAALAAHRAVLARREALAAEPNAGPGATADVGRSLAAVASLLAAIGKAGEAEAALHRAEGLLAGPARSDPTARAVLAACRSRLGQLLQETGKPDAALEAYRLARADQEALADAPGAANEARRDLADTMGRIGSLLQEIGKSADAEAEYRAALAIYQRLADENPADIELRWRLADLHRGLSSVLYVNYRSSDVDAGQRAALAIYQKLAEENPGVAVFRKGLADVRIDLVWDAAMQAKTPDAEAVTREALAIYQRLADENPADIDFRMALAATRELLAKASRRPSGAEAEYRAALAIYQRLVDENPRVTRVRWALANAHSNFGESLKRLGRASDAAAEYRAAIVLWRSVADDNPTEYAHRSRLGDTHRALAGLLLKSGRLSDAETEYRTELGIRRRLVEANPAVLLLRRRLATALLGLSRIDRRRGRYPEAAASLRESKAIQEGLPPGAGHNMYALACTQSSIAGLAAEPGSGVTAAEGRAAADRAVDTLRRAIATGSPDLGDMRIDPDLDPLRSRPDFQLLLMDLAMPVDPFAR